MQKSELIIMVGLPASGKSHVVKTIHQRCERIGEVIETVSLDIIKSKPRMLRKIKELAEDGVSMIIDNTNLNVSTRAEIIEIVKKIDNEYFVRAVYLNTSLERCMHNNYYRYLLNHLSSPKKIPDFVYKMMIKKLTVPSKKEKIDCIDTVKPCVPIDERYYHYYY